ncbi:MAG: M14 family metallopeptidase [Oscillospiraceae bacterium]|nr:M14 family metallopeptidase [Oscillospiraceae bacterium]
METLRIGSAGPWVELFQSVLAKTGRAVAVDGVFGPLTRDAAADLQRASGLTPDGVAGAGTWRALRPLTHGYDLYTIAPGDTLYSVANRYSAGFARIAAANPGVNPYNLQVGQRIVVPLGAVVPTGISYSSGIMRMNIDALKTVYPFIETGSAGSSALCAGIPYMRIGTGPVNVFYNASFHANEWITSPLLMKFAENYARAYAVGADIYGYPARELYRGVSIYIAPMVNPDGVDLVTGAFRPGHEAYEAAREIALGFPGIPFPNGWKANIEGIDLNLQFPANWDAAREIKFSQGFDRPAPRDYVGPAPLFAPESEAMYKFALKHDFRLLLCYHTQGMVIYWQYLNYMPPGALYIGELFAASSGYTLERTPYTSGFAGYKDWFIQEYNRPGYTVEAGYGVSPLPISQFGEIYADNEGILVLGAATQLED